MSKVCTLRDVARNCGISVFTASRVMNGITGRTKRSAERAVKIRAIAERMGYRPNLAARAMNTRCTRLIGVVVRNPDTGLPSHPQVGDYVNGIDVAVRAAGCATVLVDPGDREGLAMRERVVDGVILVSQFGIGWVEVVSKAFPVRLWLDGRSTDGAPALLRDERGGVASLMALLAKECRPARFVFLAPLGGEDAHYSEAERLAAVRRGAGRLSAPMIVERHSAGIRTGDWITSCLERHGRGTCFIAYNIQQAEILGHAALARGWCVPRDIALVCCDGHGLAGYTWPQLTHVRFDAAQAGAKAVQMLMGIIDGSTPSEPISRYPLVLKTGDSHRMSQEPA